MRPTRRAKRPGIEQGIKKLIATWLTHHRGLVHYYMIPQSFRGVRYGSPFLRNGTADILLSWYGKFVGIECKRPAGVRIGLSGKTTRYAAGVLSPAQKAYGEALRRSGGIYIVAHSLDDVRKVLEPLIPARQALPPFQPRDEEE